MNIYDMLPGKTYLVGDFLGQDEVICLGQKFDDKLNCHVVNVKYISSGIEDVFYETQPQNRFVFVKQK